MPEQIHQFNEVCKEWGYTHKRGCDNELCQDAVKLNNGNSPHGERLVPCPTPVQCEERALGLA